MTTYAESVKSYESEMTAICPRCGREHQVYLLWTGRGVPRIFCKQCKNIVNNIKVPEKSGKVSFT